MSSTINRPAASAAPPLHTPTAAALLHTVAAAPAARTDTAFPTARTVTAAPAAFPTMATPQARTVTMAPEAQVVTQAPEEQRVATKPGVRTVTRVLALAHEEIAQLAATVPPGDRDRAVLAVVTADGTLAPLCLVHTAEATGRLAAQGACGADTRAVLFPCRTCRSPRGALARLDQWATHALRCTAPPPDPARRRRMPRRGRHRGGAALTTMTTATSETYEPYETTEERI